jgi:hypothetical protein
MAAGVWHVFDPASPDEIVATLRFQPGVEGDSGNVTIEADSENIREFLMYYLDDPLDQHPVHIEGLGSQQGPHSENLEQFELAIRHIGHYFPSFASRPAEDE